MDDDATMVLREDGVVAVFAVEGIAAFAALEQAIGVLVAEVPAAIALAKVAAQRRHVADLRAGDLACRSRKGREMLPQYGVGGDVGELDARADRHGLVGDGDVAHAGDLAEA